MNTNIHISEKRKKTPAAQDQVHGKVNAGVMDAVCAGEGIFEEASASIETWYRGCSNLNENGFKGCLWLTDSIEYAKTYAEMHGTDGYIVVYSVDMSQINVDSPEHIVNDEYFPTKEEIDHALTDGINGYFVDYYDFDAQGLCLFDEKPIIKKTILPQEEYQKVESLDEGAEPEANEYHIGFENNSSMEYGHITEDRGKENTKIAELIKDLAKFMKGQGLNVYPYPKVKLNWEPQGCIFIKTGYYEPEKKQIVVFCSGRHPKDILRTFAHEMIHHSQNLDGKDLQFTSNDTVKEDDRLEKIEGEAYLKGNIYFRKWTEGLKENPTAHLIKESISYDSVENEEMNPDDVDLSSFDIKKNLNPKFWKNGKLDSRIRMKLLDIADDFMKFSGVDWVTPDDVILTGSLANFNWNKRFSDIDLHILIDFSKVDERTDFVDNYFFSQKKLWNEEHKDIRIYGFPVEVFVQDSNSIHISTGIYSLDKDAWIAEPEKQKLSPESINKSFVKKTIAKYIDLIDTLNDVLEDGEDSEFKARKIGEIASIALTSIQAERRRGLSDGGEFSDGNIIFKALRRLGYIEKLKTINSSSYDKTKSMP